MIDRFGLLPEHTKQLFRVTSLKLRCQSDWASPRSTPDAQGGKLLFEQDTPVDPLALVKLVQVCTAVLSPGGRQPAALPDQPQECRQRASTLLAASCLSNWSRKRHNAHPNDYRIRHMRQLIPLLFTCIVLHPPLAWGQADDLDSGQSRWFQIELLLFRNLSAAAQQEEQWPEVIDIWSPEPSYQMPGADGQSTAARSLEVWQAPEIQLIDAEENWIEPKPEPELAQLGGELQYRGVPAAERHLYDMKNRLGRRNDYRVLDYRAWRQELVNDEDPVYFRVEAGRTHQFYHELEGYIGFALKRYLHVDTELWWGEYPTQGETVDNTDAAGIGDAAQTTLVDAAEDRQTSASQQPESFNHRRVVRAAHLKEQRRMRSNEVHYFDHPLIGVMVRISPWEGPIN